MKEIVKSIINFVNNYSKVILSCVGLAVLLALACYHSEPISSFDPYVGASGAVGIGVAALFFIGGIVLFYSIRKKVKDETGEWMSILRFLMVCFMAFLACGVMNIGFEALKVHFGMDLHLVTYWCTQIVIGMFVLCLAGIVLKLIAGVWDSISRWAAKA